MVELLHQILFLPEQASTLAPRIDRLHYFVIVTTMVMSTAVGMAALLLFVRYRRRSDTQVTRRVHPKLWVEVAFVAVPLAFFLLWFAIGFRDYVWAFNTPKNAMDVYVMGKQWMWKFTYPEGPNSIGVLRVPVNRPVRLLMTSRDVIHSFFVPDFRIKMDVVPGRYTEAWFEATKPGRYQILCTEYCGLNHSTMWGEVLVIEQAEYDAWLSDQRRSKVSLQDARPFVDEELPSQGSMASQGARLYVSQGCAKCHSIDGTPHLGPTWLGLYLRNERLQTGATVVADERYLTESMMDPQAQLVEGFKPLMPSFQGKLSEPEVAALLEYIKSLGNQRP